VRVQAWVRSAFVPPKTLTLNLIFTTLVIYIKQIKL
jgi:hypothetical protein